MNKSSILFLTKDALTPAYLPCYGNKFWVGKTPNLDELASKGTVFSNAFTAAPSSAMSYLTMFTRRYPYEQEIQTYLPLRKPYEGQTLFDDAYDLGFECHVIWDEHWIQLAQRYSECYGKHTTMHNLKNLRQGVGPNYKRDHPLVRNEQLTDDTLLMMRREVECIMNSDKKTFIWCHLPHVLNGRISYADDIDVFDRYLGMFREFFSDDNIFISGDHGNMNGMRGKVRYGFDVYDPAIRIPLIAPRVNDTHIYKEQFCNIDFFELIFKREIVKREFIFSDCAYYAQPRRKLAVIYGKYRYIYNKEKRTEELYDVEWDPHQDFNLMYDYVYDVDRHIESPARELYFYPGWDLLPEVREKLRNMKDSIWREPTKRQQFMNSIKNTILSNQILKKGLLPVIKKVLKR